MKIGRNGNMSNLVGAGLVPARKGDRVRSDSVLNRLMLAGRHKAGPYILLFLTSFAFASDFQISASLDRNRSRLNEQAVLALTISGSSNNLPQPQLPGLTDFQIYNAGRSQNFTWINGKASASITYNFVLTPLREGHFVIPLSGCSSGRRRHKRHRWHWTWSREMPPLSRRESRGKKARRAPPPLVDRPLSSSPARWIRRRCTSGADHLQFPSLQSRSASEPAELPASRDDRVLDGGPSSAAEFYR